MIDNLTFLRAIFGDQYVWSHVTSFIDDPSSIPNDRKGICWAGGYYQFVPLIPDSNQFYTVSTFTPDERSKSKRRKAQFSAQYLLVLDDVEEKLPLSQVQKLPEPSFVLQSSNNSYQWGYIFNVPETNRNRLDNLTDQLISNGLAPSGDDPGMKGVTRYIRLPEGVNTKSKRIIENGGTPPRCSITTWNPERRYSLEQLADPFNVDLDAPRHEARTDGATEILDHPVLNKLTIKSVLSAGRYDITCPWIDTHTGMEDNGSAIFTNDDGSIGFQCHHGHCQERTAKHLIDRIEETNHGFKIHYKQWQVARQFADIAIPAVIKETPAQLLDFMGDGPTVKEVEEEYVSYQDLYDAVAIIPQNDSKFIPKLSAFLQVMDSAKELDKVKFHKHVCTLMEWSKATLNKVLADFREDWYQNTENDYNWLLNNIVLLTENNGGFYNLDRKVYQSVGAMNATYGHLNFSGDAPATVISNAKNKKIADGQGWYPVDTPMFDLNGRTYVNTYNKPNIIPKKHDVSDWIELCTFIFGDYVDLVMDHMAFSLQHPETKIRWQCLIWGRERTGKSMSVRPLIKIMGDSASEIGNDQFENGYDDIYAGMKVLSFEEVMQGDVRQFNRLKSKLANDGLEKLNIKSRGMVTQQNLYSMYLFSNHEDALQFNDTDGKLLVINSPDGFIKGNNSKDWYTSLGKRIDNDNDFIAGCYWYLLNRDVSEFEYSVLPVKTDAMKNMVRVSRPEYEQIVMELIEHKEEMFAHDFFKLADLMQYLKDKGYRFARKNLIKRLRMEGYDTYKAATSINGQMKQVRFWGLMTQCEGVSHAKLYEKLMALSPDIKLGLVT